jgi:fructokinase
MLKSNEYVVGVDLGGTKVEACLANGERLVFNRERRLIDTSRGMDHAIATIVDLINTVAGGKPYAAVGMGTPGTYVPGEDRLYGAPNSRVYEIPGFIKRLGAELGVPLLVENDANCLALAEFFAGCEGKYGYVLAVIMGTGFGSGLIMDNRLYRGARGGAGELGHTCIELNGRLCGCGRRGCVEAYLSGSSLSRRFHEMTGKKLDVPEIYRLYEAGDNHAVSLFGESVEMLGRVFANAVNLLDLEAVILGGGVSNLPVWYEPHTVSRYLKQFLFGVPRGDIPLIKAALGDSAGVIGAAYLALRHLGKMSF